MTRNDVGSRPLGAVLAALVCAAGFSAVAIGFSSGTAALVLAGLVLAVGAQVYLLCRYVAFRGHSLH